MKLKENPSYAMLVLTSIGIRIAPLSGQPVHSSEYFILQAKIAETNLSRKSSYMAYFIGYLTERLQENYLQAQRDCFGALIYEGIAIPRCEFFHTNCTGRLGTTASNTYYM